jgi:hypothetical protein
MFRIQLSTKIGHRDRGRSRILEFYKQSLNEIHPHQHRREGLETVGDKHVVFQVERHNKL